MSNGTAKRRRPAGGSGQQPAPPTDNNSRHSESEPRCRDESSEERDTQQDQHHWLDRVPVLGRFLRLAPIDTRTELAVTGVLVLLLLSTLMGWLVVTNFTGSARFSHAFLSLQVCCPTPTASVCPLAFTLHPPPPLHPHPTTEGSGSA